MGKPTLHGRDHLPGGADPIHFVFPTSRYSNEILYDPVGGLVLYWKLDELGNTTTTATDSSGNGHDGTYGASSAHPTLGVAALADGTAADFDGSEDYVALGSYAGSALTGLTGFGKMSVEFWMKTSQTTATDSGAAPSLDSAHAGIICADDSTAGGRFFRVELTLATGQLRYVIFGTDGTGHALAGSAVVNDGNRHYVVCTFDGTTMKIYVDGVLDTSTAPAMGGFPLANTLHALFVGSGVLEPGPFVLQSHYHGTLDELALYTTDLPLASIQTHYLLGGTASNPPSGTAGGDLAGSYPNPTLATFGPGATGPIGDSTHVAAVTTDAKGRVSALSSVAISGATLTAAPSANTTGDGIKIGLTAGETLAFGDPVYIKSDGKVWKADADTAGTFPAIGIALGSAAANAAVTVLLLGVARNDSWSWTVGGLVYLSTSSGLTQTQPSATDNAIQVIGIATNAARLYVNPQLVYITHV